MAVTAQGYAKLADKLQADIAVLEGGYSVEAALPYVNTGIILAMADMDYSKVVEPDQSDLRQQDERCNKRVDQLIAETGELWRSRFSTRKELLAKCGNSWSRKKSIYYDEEGSEKNRSRPLIIAGNAAVILRSGLRLQEHASEIRARLSFR